MEFTFAGQTINYQYDRVASDQAESGSDQAPPILCLLHCFGSNHGFWDLQLPYFPGCSLLRPDARGHGQSSQPAGPYSIAQMAEDVIALLDHLGLSQIHIAGASMGGMVAQHLAIYHPNRISSVMLVTTTFEYPDEQRERWKALGLAVQRDGIASVQDVLMERWFAPASREENRPGYQFMANVFSQFHPDSFAFAAEAVRLVDFGAQLNRISQPTLVIASEHDPGVIPERSRQLADSIANSQLIWTPHAHHLASLEHPGFVGRAMADFLADQRS